MSSPPKRNIVVTTTRSPPKRNSSGRQQRISNSSAGSNSRPILPGLRRTRTMPASMPSPHRISASAKMMAGPRLSKFFELVSLDDASTSATSFLSMSLSNHSTGNAHNSGSGSGSSRFRTSSVRAAEICVEELDIFVSKVLPEFVQEKGLVTLLDYAVKDYSDATDSHHAALQELALGLTSILESTPSLPASVVAELHSYRGLVHLEQENAYASAIECFTRALWIQSHMSKSSSSSAPGTTMIASNASHLWDVAMTEHRLGVAYGRSGKYLKAIDQMEHAIKSYDKAGVGISESCYVEAKEDLHEFQEAHQISLIRSSGRHHIRTSILRRTKSFGGRQNRPSAKLIPDEVKVELEREFERDSSSTSTC
ncbi:expressed unknown protein [Seminavis robusta]|uniref:Uncharacterized protein n=1 Tax=Seminavis robusta TaxID=568900 RepID=A0A9N8F2H0_9STRA|nr:expressed unknown protein [Seminavis robusta]|eukprot:Sro2422_g327170.1 n/a (368) ;mRNA; f:4560-5663